MATVNKKIADRIIAGDFPEDNATRIVEYDNAFGGKGYGVTYHNQDKETYMRESPYIKNPKIYWDKP
jgi:hypothetical protein